jgi:hypothetical protein
MSIVRAVAFALALCILATPLFADGQQGKQVRIGYLSGIRRPDTQEAVDAFRGKLREPATSRVRIC